jgi:hypothetical protein
MPVTSRVYVRASLFYLGLGAVLGALFLIDRWLPLGAWLYALKASHVQFVISGWLIQFILGIAWWLFPPLPLGQRPDGTPARRGQAQRGSETLFWATFALLNAGILLRALGAPLQVWTRLAWLEVATGLSGLFLLAAAVTFVLNVWARVRALGRGA